MPDMDTRSIGAGMPLCTLIFWGIATASCVAQIPVPPSPVPPTGIPAVGRDGQPFATPPTSERQGSPRRLPRLAGPGHNATCRRLASSRPVGPPVRSTRQAGDASANPPNPLARRRI